MWQRLVTHITNVCSRSLDTKLLRSLVRDQSLLVLASGLEHCSQVEADLRAEFCSSSSNDVRMTQRTSPSSGFIDKAFCKCSSALSGRGGVARMYAAPKFMCVSAKIC